MTDLASRERVRTAIKNSGLVYPLRRITVNLAPAELPKQVFEFPVMVLPAKNPTAVL